jgi:hypothetical protein
MKPVRAVTWSRGLPIPATALLARHGYLPDASAGATEVDLHQMETFAEEWSQVVVR